jgi:hypothetical protein
MGQFSIFLWLIVFVLPVNLLPIGKILSRTGHNPGWCLLILFPFLNAVII